MKKGTELALDVINGAGGINGTKVEVIFEDDRLSAADAQTAFLKLVQSDKVPVIMGSGASSLSLSLCPKAQEKKIVQISSISTAPSLKDCGKYFFSAMASDTAQGPEWVKVAEAPRAPRKPRSCTSTTTTASASRTPLSRRSRQAGGKVLIAQPFELGGKDFRTEVLKVKATNPKVRLHRGPRGRRQHRHQAGQGTGHGHPVGDRRLDGRRRKCPSWPAQPPKARWACAPARRQTPEYKAFQEAFKKKFNEEPTIWSDFAYDTMMLVAKAIEKGGYTADGIQKALLRGGRDVCRAVGRQEVRRVRHRPGCLRVDDRQGRSVGSCTRRSKPASVAWPTWVGRVTRRQPSA